jgi:predicted transposase YbfD/YdcC
MARKSKKLIEIAGIIDGHTIEEFEEINITVMKELVEELSEISDPRDEAYVRHKLADIIMIVLFAVMANANEWGEIESFGKKKEKWLRKFLVLEHGFPTDDTYRIVMSKLNVQYVYRLITRFLIEKLTEILSVLGTGEEAEQEKGILSCDGKASNGSGRKETGKESVKSLNTLNAYSSEWDMCIDQEFIEEKSNEIPAMPRLLKRLNLEGTIVTWDALNTQTETVKAVIDRKEGRGDYVGALKGNQGTLHTDVKDYFDEPTKAEIKEGDKEHRQKKYKSTTEKEHSAVVRREYYLDPDIDWLHDKDKWAGLKAIGVEVKTTEKMGDKTAPICEERYFISSIDNIDDFARAVRGHWGVENKLHWHLDYTFRDDKNTTMKNNGAEGLQLFKKIALSLLKIAQVIYPPRTSLKKIRYRLSLDYENEIERIFTALDVDSIKKVLAK